MNDIAIERRWVKWLPILLLLLGLCALPLFFVFDRPQTTDTLSRIKQAGTLRVLTVNGPNTFYEGADGPMGPEYELASTLAESLDVKLKLVVADSVASLIPRLVRGDAHLAAAGITVTDQRQQIIKFSQPLQQIQQQVVYLRGNKRPRRVEDLIGRRIQVVAGSSASERLAELKVDHPDLHWTNTSGKDAEELLIEVSAGKLELTIANSQTVALVRQHHPQIRVAFVLPHSESVAWAFPTNVDPALYEAANAFLIQKRKSGVLKQLLDRYYGAVQKFDYVNVATFRRRIFSVLPLYKSLFITAAEQTRLDWRLLAAQAYQESQWDPKAISPTGVRGMMQLTMVTANRLNIADRDDPEQSVLGGASYVKNLMKRLPKQVLEPDRTWLALAAYNVGFGHLMDAIRLTKSNGGDPNKWVDVKESLPLLTIPKWYKQTKHGYARGHEPVSYVTRIRSFYDILVKIDEREKPSVPALQKPVPAI